MSWNERIGPANRSHTDRADAGPAPKASRSQQKRNSQLSNRVVEDTRGVTSEDSSLLALRNINVVVTHRHGSHSLQLRTSSIEKLSIDLLGKHAQTSIATLNPFQKLITRNGLIRVVPVNQLNRRVSEHLHGRGGDLSGDKNLPLKCAPNSHLGLGSRSESANKSTSLHNSSDKNILRKDRCKREMEKQRNGDDTEIHGPLLFLTAFMSILRQSLNTSGTKLLRTAKAFLFDCDGVIWKGNQPIAGSIETINYLKKIGKLVFYVVFLHVVIQYRPTTLQRAGKKCCKNYSSLELILHSMRSLRIFVQFYPH